MAMKACSVLLANVVDRTDIGMIEGGGSLGFAVKTGEGASRGQLRPAGISKQQNGKRCPRLCTPHPCRHRRFPRRYGSARSFYQFSVGTPPLAAYLRPLLGARQWKWLPHQFQNLNLGSIEQQRAIQKNLARLARIHLILFKKSRDRIVSCFHSFAVAPEAGFLGKHRRRRFWLT